MARFGRSVGLLFTIAGLAACLAVRQAGVKLYPQKYRPEGEPSKLEPVFNGRDEKRKHLAIELRTVAQGFAQPTAAQFVPGEPDTVVVLQKDGALRRVTLPSGEVTDVVKLEVTTASEQGLLGIAFHPDFEKSRRFFLGMTVKAGGKDKDRIEEWKAATPFSSAAPTRVRTVIEQEDPYANHNGGHLLFGPDGMLYFSWGDGGYRADPHGNGQRFDTLLGKMLRIDVNASPYAVPKDNPFVGKAGARGEIWAYGLRNPWRFAFDPKGRLVVADVGQDLYEEVGFVARGDDAGWNILEGRHCFEPKEGCKREGLREPFIEYGRDEGQSVTGGVVATGKAVPGLEGRYVFGDFVSGRLWAAELPTTVEEKPKQLEPVSLGKWPVLPVHFFNDPSGDVWLVDFSGKLMRIAAPERAR